MIRATAVRAGKLFPVGSYGHTGWTGTSLWIDPFSQTFVIFLSNRNHPDESGNVGALRAKLGTLAAEAIRDFNFASVPGALACCGLSRRRVAASGRESKPRPAQLESLNGIDVLVRQKFAPLKGLRLGLITNHTGQDRDRNPTIDLLKNAPGVELKALFSPEHGIRGGAGREGRRQRGREDRPARLQPLRRTIEADAEQLKDLDALVFDIQDIGCRFYTYTATMGLTLEAAGENGKKYFVLDRVNPINGVTVDGPVRLGKESFVAFHEVPLRYGMTIGELARMCNAERNCKADLTVIQVENWQRDAWFDQTGLPWTNPSPNMRSLTAAILYPGVGLLESALSVGRGTDTPFEVVGAPYIDDVKLAEALNGAGLPGVRFRAHPIHPHLQRPQGPALQGGFHPADRPRPVQRGGRGPADRGDALSPLPEGLRPRQNAASAAAPAHARGHQSRQAAQGNPRLVAEGPR